MPSLADAAPRVAALGILVVAVALSQLLRPRALPRLPWEELGQPVPGTDGSVLLLDGFLSEVEVQHILAAGRQALGLATASPAQQARMYASTELHARDDPVLAALDERVANLSGIPVHAGEGTFRVAVSRPWLGAAAATEVKVQSPPPPPPPGKTTRLPARLAVQPHRQVLVPHGIRTYVHQVQNLHHDTAAGRPGRVATLLVYLSDSESSDLAGGGTFRVSLARACACTVRTTVQRARHTRTTPGGETLFPCAKRAAIANLDARVSGGGSSLAELRRLCSSLVAAFARDERFLKPSGASNSR